jgi:hypothetical protein
VINIANKYLVLAGLFDLSASQIKGNIPFYKKYGRMGEAQFVTDMCNVVQAAANAGAITDSDTPQTVYAKIVLPWINQMGFGSFSDSNAEMIGYILMGMIAEYCGGVYASRWYARGGDMPFGSLHPFTLPQAQQPAQSQVTASPTPSPTASTPTGQTAAQPITELQSYLAGTVPIALASIHYGRAPSGNFFQLPSAATFLQRDPTTGAWIFAINGVKSYVDNSGVIQPWVDPSATQQATAQVNASTTGGASATDSSGQNIPVQYIPSGGGSGGSYTPTPTTLPALVASNATGLSTTEELGIGALLVVGVLFFMSQKHGR